MNPTPNIWSALVRPEPKKPTPKRRVTKKEESLPEPEPEPPVSRILPYIYTRRKAAKKSIDCDAERSTVETGNGEFPASYVSKDWFVVRSSEVPVPHSSVSKKFKLPYHSCVFMLLEPPGKPVLYLCQNADTLEIRCADLNGVISEHTTLLYEQYKDEVFAFCTALAQGTVVKCPYTTGSEFHKALALQGDTLNDTVPGVVCQLPRNAFTSLTHPQVVFNRFEIDTNYYKALKDVMGLASEEEIRLPFEYCAFSLNYFADPQVLYVHQCPKSNKITLLDKEGEVARPEVERDLSCYLVDVFAVCIALDSRLVTKCTIEPNPGKEPSVFDSPVSELGHTYTLLEIKREVVSINGYSASTGRKITRLHVRRGHYVNRGGTRFWRRWSIIGNFSLGSITKDYKVTV